MYLFKSLKITPINTADELDASWDLLCKSVYQRKAFLTHLERYNYCHQKYYQCYNNGKLIAGCVMYFLKVNILTFAKYEFNLPMTIIGIPASVDASGIVGTSTLFLAMLKRIMNEQKGIILCLNNDKPLSINKTIEMITLPTMTLTNKSISWEAYLGNLRHNYRRRVLQAQNKFSGVLKKIEPCSKFTKEHYDLYLKVIDKTATKLEVLRLEFFTNLSSDHRLHSFYHNNILLTWHITTLFNRTYYFLFGGINYSLRDRFDSYYNNLIHIIIEAIQNECKTINMGQTAEISKNRLGAKPETKHMFIYHNNSFVRTIFKLSKNLLEYKLKPKMIEAQKLYPIK